MGTLFLIGSGLLRLICEASRFSGTQPRRENGHDRAGWRERAAFAHRAALHHSIALEVRETAGDHIAVQAGGVSDLHRSKRADLLAEPSHDLRFLGGSSSAAGEFRRGEM